jgi:predicted small metal-binding protein
MEVGTVHGKEVHDIQEFTPDMLEMVKSLIKDE